MLRRVQLLLVGGVLLVAALTTGAQFLFFLVYLGALVLIGAGADFSNVGAIDIRINGTSLTPALDMQIDSIQARLIPEPASLASLGLFAAAGLFLRRRNH